MHVWKYLEKFQHPEIVVFEIEIENSAVFKMSKCPFFNSLKCKHKYKQTIWIMDLKSASNCIIINPKTRLLWKDECKSDKTFGLVLVSVIV